MNVNGWPIIERMLYRRKKNQSDLARLLRMSPAAITQIKKGDFLLSAESLEKILFYLGAGTEEENELFIQIIQSRFFKWTDNRFSCRVIIIRRR